MMINYYERVEEVFEVNIQLFMQSRICVTNFVNIDPIVLELCCVELISRMYVKKNVSSFPEHVLICN